MALPATIASRLGRPPLTGSVGGRRGKRGTVPEHKSLVSTQVLVGDPRNRAITAWPYGRDSTDSCPKAPHSGQSMRFNVIRSPAQVSRRLIR